MHGVTDREEAAGGVVEADHVAGKRALDALVAARAEEHRRGRERELALRARVRHLHALIEAPAHDAHVRHAVAVLRIEVGLHLEHKTREFAVRRLERLVITQRPGSRPRPQVDELVQKRLDALVAHGAAEVDGRHLALLEFFVVEGRRQLPNHLAVLFQLRV